MKWKPSNLGYESLEDFFTNGIGHEPDRLVYISSKVKTSSIYRGLPLVISFKNKVRRIVLCGDHYRRYHRKGPLEVTLTGENDIVFPNPVSLDTLDNHLEKYHGLAYLGGKHSCRAPTIVEDKNSWKAILEALYFYQPEAWKASDITGSSYEALYYSV